MLSQFLRRFSRQSLWLCVAIQAAFLLTRPELLPVWGDEHFTLTASQRPAAELLGVIAAEQNNPPLHTVLLHWWLLLPWPVSPLAAARLLSALLLLAATIVIDRLWLVALTPAARGWFLLLWALSPCLLLYARIARSYSLQVLLFAVALHLTLSLLRGEHGLGKAALVGLAISGLLYAHYLPGLALLAACLIFLAAEAWRNRRLAPLRAAGTVASIVVALYAAWIAPLAGALGRLLHAPPTAEAAPATEVVRLFYLAFSLICGETPPDWALVGGMLLLPGAAWLAWRGVRATPEWLPLVALVGVLAFIGAGRWVSFAFTPGRLLFLLPFVLMLVARGASSAGRAGAVICLGLTVLSLGSAASYFRRSDFLNKGYLLPYGEIAAVVNATPPSIRTVLLADACNTDPVPLAALLRSGVPVIVVGRESALHEVRRRLAPDTADVIWAFRNTHDTSPGGLNRELEEQLSRETLVHRRLYVPYDRRDRLFMRLLGWHDRPSHFIQLLEFRFPDRATAVDRDGGGG